MRRIKFAAIFICLSVFCFAQNVGEKVYKEVTVNGETLSKWLEVTSLEEYDSKGNHIYYKNSNGYEAWSEHDSRGKEIHYKDSYGYERWSEYDSNGNMIHYKNSYGKEEWSETASYS